MLFTHAVVTRSVTFPVFPVFEIVRGIFLRISRAHRCEKQVELINFPSNVHKRLIFGGKQAKTSELTVDSNSTYSDNQRFLFQEKYHATKELKGLLIPWLYFRLYVYFKKDTSGNKGSGVHFYSNEHRCSYNQCLHRRVPQIDLDREAGYNGLVQLIEKGSFRGKYKTAIIYSQSVFGSRNFDLLHREYHNGKLVLSTQNDPVFTIGDMLVRNPDRQGLVSEVQVAVKKSLYYTIEHGRLVLHETPVDENNF
jgi:hypothetical protein